MSRKQRIWSEIELTIAYYIARWDYAGLKISEYEMVEYIIQDTTINSLNMQVANFRFLLGIDGRQLEDASKAMRELVNKLDGKTIVQIRRTILDYACEKDTSFSINCHKQNNKAINKKKDKLNEQYRFNFEKELERRSRGRRLVRKN